MIVFAIISIMVIQSCSKNDESNTATVQLKLIDAPGDYLEVNVEIVDVQYNSSDNEQGWTSFKSFNGPITVDLTELIAGNSLLLTNEIIPAGMLKQIRLILSDNNMLVIDGETEPVHLDTPSAQQSGLKLKLDTKLEAGFSYTFILDWDVQKSVVKAGNSGKYNLKPVIRVNAEVNSGSISGRVIEIVEGVETALEGVTIVNLSKGVDTWSAEANSNGDFLFQGLKAGTYTLTIQETGYVDYTSDVSVTVGNVTKVDKITLTLIPPTTP